VAAGVLACVLTASASAQTAPSVTVAILPFETDPEDLEGIDGLSPGLMSAGLSTVTSIQTYLDIGAGNRVFTSLYDDDLPVIALGGNRVPGWDQIADRGENAPADIVPGLLGSTLGDGGVPVSADRLLTTPSLIAVDREGEIPRTEPLACVQSSCPGLSVVPARPEGLAALVGRLRGEDLLIAIERAPPPRRDTLTIAVAGSGFDGNLTSDTTRAPGFVIATDIAPTILDRFSLAIPEEMNGNPMESEGGVDYAAVAERGARMRVVAGRRSPVIVDNLMIWFAVAALVTLLSRGRLRSPAFAMLGLTSVYAPTLLLVGAATLPSEDVERVIVGLGAPVAAALTLLAFRSWSALAVACAVTVSAYTIDVIAGSPLTAQSLLGPNPGLGVRFFGIGNELEAVLAVLIPGGVGAALVAASERGAAPSRRAAAVAFMATGLGFAAIFAAGRFGADVGAAIVFPAGAAFATLAVPGAMRGRGRGRKTLLMVVAAPLAGLAVLAVLDLVLGGDAHLSRSVFDAGGAEDLGDVAERRLRLSASSLRGATDQPLFWFALTMAVAGAVFHRRLAAWLADVPLARAGAIGAGGAVLLGVVANDSGATFFTIGTIALLGIVSFAFSRYAAGGARNRSEGPA
jgi:hypothetical protein